MQGGASAGLGTPVPALTTYMGPLHCRMQSVYSTCRILRRMPASAGTGEGQGERRRIRTRTRRRRSCLPLPHLQQCPCLTQLPAPHVVELCAQQQRGHDVDDGKDNPERRVPLPKDLWGEQTVGNGVP